MRKILAGAVICLFSGLAGAEAQVRFNGLNEGSNSEPSPVVSGGEIAFSIHRGVCTSRPYGDGRGESNCSNRNVQSYVGTTNRNTARVGQTWAYAFDFRIDPRTNHRGHHQPEAARFTGGGVNNSRLEIARWQGQDQIKNHIYDIEVDTTRGVTFLGRRCIAPSEFGGWHSFQMVVTWSDDATGMIQVACDGRVIHAAEALATNQAPHCHVANHCEPGARKNPQSFYFQFGAFHDPVWDRNGAQWAPIPDGGLTFRYRDVVVRRLRR